MSFLTALRQKLLDTPQISAIVDDRVIVTDVAPEETEYPFINLWAPSRKSFQHLTGNSGLGRAMVWLHCWAEAGDECDDLMEKMRLAVQGFIGEINGYKITSVEHDTGRGPEFDTEARVYGGTHEFFVMYEEAETL